MPDWLDSAEQSAAAPAGGAALPSLGGIAVLIPAWQPTAVLLTLVGELLHRDFSLLLVVDDGSGATAQPVFEAVAALPRVEVLRHADNLGKGRALKSGFHHLLARWPGLEAVVTADADGQHTPQDIERVAESLLSERTRPVLGSRSFARDVPLRSRLGNALTRQVFVFITGVRLRDTQTGLRGLPFTVVPQLLTLEGERYEYEMTMLVHLCRSGQVPVEVPIATIYLENNRDSHFNPLRDSMRIYLVLLRFCASCFHSAGA